MYLHVGTYSGHIISYQGMIDNFAQLHNFQASQSSIRSMARSSKYLIVGGYDELLHIYSITSNTQQGEVNCQQGVINKIKIIGDMFLTGGEDGSVCVWKLGTWERVHKSREHKSIETMDVHPSGKVMITIGKERKLIIWNLLKFIRVLDIKLTFDAKKVLFYQDNILILSDNIIYQLDTANNTTVNKTQEKSKIQDGLIYKDYIITSHQNGEIKLYSAKDYSLFYSFESGKFRVKCLGLIELEENDLLVSADSEGNIKFWHLPSLIGKKFQKVEECIFLIKKVGQRVLCISTGMEEFEEKEYEGNDEEQDEVQQYQQEEYDEEPVEDKKKAVKTKKISKPESKGKIGTKGNYREEGKVHRKKEHNVPHKASKGKKHRKD